MGDVGRFAGLVAKTPSGEMTFAAVVTVIIGTFVSGGTQATNLSRFVRLPRIAVIATMIVFFSSALPPLVGIVAAVLAYAGLVNAVPSAAKG